jgi:NADP-dependent 3-hydroxy acid dehydrogenase YdfG
VRADVVDAAAIERAVATAEARFGPAACLVANAGLVRMLGLAERTPDDYGYEIDVLFKGVLNSVRAVLPGMRARRAGTIVVVGSIGDRRPGPGGSVYDAAKAATHSIAQSLQMSEAATGVRVVNIAPGFVRTDIHAKSGIPFEEYKRLLGAVTFLDPKEIADITLYCYKAPAHVCVRDLVVMPTDARYG